MSQHPYAGLRPGHNAFGQPISDPDELDFTMRVDVMRRLSGKLQAMSDREAAWLGRKVGAWLAGQSGQDLVAALGLRPSAGSHVTAPALIEQQRIDGVLLRLSVAAGGDAAALRCVSGDPPAALRDLVAELGDYRPQSASRFSRARDRARPA